MPSTIVQRRTPLDAIRQLVHELLCHRRQRTLTDDVQSRFGRRRDETAPRIGKHVESLLPLEHTDEERRGASGSGATGSAVKGSRSMNAGNSAVGSMPSARTSSVVYALIVLTASVRRNAIRARASAKGASRRRAFDP